MTSSCRTNSGKIDGLITVVIGRNEGERLRRCLTSAKAFAQLIVYVDSGSTDNSLHIATSLDAVIVLLDVSKPFTAARARNAGWQRGLELLPDASLVQFVDGDCEIRDCWWHHAADFLSFNPNVAAVCGRRRERYPGISIYNRMCDLEWDTPIGQALACGGDCMMRMQALVAVGGYRDSMIAGEEPELCVRLRASGSEIWRLDVEMTWHDAAITRFSQWWKRAQRGGHAYAEGSYLHGAGPTRHWLRETLRIVCWGIFLPAIVLTLLLASAVLHQPYLLGLSVGLLLLYPAKWATMLRRLQGDLRFRAVNAWLLVLAKFAEAAGFIQFYSRKLFFRKFLIIEYK